MCSTSQNWGKAGVINLLLLIVGLLLVSIITSHPVFAISTIDSDGDGIADDIDAFPWDYRESLDSDGDGVGDNGDPDSYTYTPVPAVIEAEQFDIAYDTTTDNLGDESCGVSAVDVTEVEVNGECVLSHITDREWTAYGITVSEAGTYEMVFKIAATQRVPFTVSLREQSSGDWRMLGSRIWLAPAGFEQEVDYVFPIDLPIGNHVVRVNYWGNHSIRFNKFEIRALQPKTFTPIPVPSRIEAENTHDSYDRTVGNWLDHTCGIGNVELEQSGDTEGGCAVIGSAMEWVEYNIAVPETANYDILARARVREGVSIDSQLHIEVDGETSSEPVIIPFADSASYANYSTEVLLLKGTRKVRVYFDTGTIHLNYLDFQAKDSDGDGVYDIEDAFPEDPNEWADFDDDGEGDNSDPDRDNDSVLDENDACLTADANLSADVDNDGCDDLDEDIDDDNDGVEDELDACPQTPVGQEQVVDGCSYAQLDSDGPVVTVSAVETPTYATSIQLMGTVADYSGVAAMYLTNDRFSGTPFAVSITGEQWLSVVPLSIGVNTITLEATDHIQLSSTTQVSIERLTDRVNTNLTILSPSAGSVVKTETVSVNGMVTNEKPANTIVVTVNGVVASLNPTADVTVHQFTVNDVPLLEGSNIIRVKAAIDYELYEDETLDESVVVVYQPEAEDYPEPTISIVNPGSNSYVGHSSFYITLNYASYVGEAQVTVNGVTVSTTHPEDGTVNELVTFPAEQAEWEIVAAITDEGGHTATTKAIYYYDNQRPEIHIVNALAASPIENIVTEQPYTISGTVSDTQLASFTINGETVSLEAGEAENTYIFSAAIALSLNDAANIHIEARDYSGNIASMDYELRLDSTVSLGMLLPPENVTLLNQGQPIELQVAARVEGIVDGYQAVGRIIQGNSTIVESDLNIGGGLISGYLTQQLSAGDYTIQIELVDSGAVLTRTTRNFTVENIQEVALALTGVEPLNGAEHLETNTPITVYFNKAIDLTKLNVQVTETAHGFSCVNTDEAGTEGFKAKGYQLVKVDIDDEPVNGGLSLLPGGRIVAFYPEREFAYDAQLSITVTYDGTEYSRSRFKTRELPTFAEGAVVDQFGQPVAGVSVELLELGRVTTTNAQGAFSFGYGDKAENAIPHGRYTLRVNNGLKLIDFGSLQEKIFINKGEQNNLGGQLLSALNKDDAFSQLTTGKDIVLAKGDLILSTQNANIFFPGGQQQGFSMALFSPVGTFPHAYDPMFMPYWLYTLHPMGVEVEGTLAFDFALPKLDIIDDYVWKDGAYILLVGLDAERDLIVPQGVGIVENHRVKLLRSEYTRLDYIGYAPMPGQAFASMQAYAEESINLDTMVTQIRGLLTSANSEGGAQ